jgi:uridine kinase
MPPRPLVIGVAGGSGAGKTTVARGILEALAGDAVLLDQDAYYKDLTHLTLDERARVNFDHPDSLDVELMIAQLGRLAAGEAIDKPTYDFARHTRAAAVIRVEPRRVVVVEGILLFTDRRLRELFDVKVYVDVDDDVRFIRRLLRDVRERGRTMENVIEQYLRTVRPMHLEFIEPSKRWADIIIPEGGSNAIGVEMLRARVELEVRRTSGT